MKSSYLIRDIVIQKERLKAFVSYIELNKNSWSNEMLEKANTYRRELVESIRKMEIILHTETLG